MEYSFQDYTLYGHPSNTTETQGEGKKPRLDHRPVKTVLIHFHGELRYVDVGNILKFLLAVL